MYSYHSSDPSVSHNQLTTTSPYAGTLSAFRTGTMLRSRYSHLIRAPEGAKKINFWASDSQRVIETAKYFATGLFGLSWAEKYAQLHIIPETSDLGGDTLTPGDTCHAYQCDKELGRGHGYKQLWKFRDTYLPDISARLHSQNPSLRFTNSEVYSMQEMCGFETLARGSSPWCDVFTHEDWLNFEYARDVLHYYRTGPGNVYSAAMGWLFLNATANILEEGPDAGTLFFSLYAPSSHLKDPVILTPPKSVHDGDILPLVTALDLYREATQSPLPTTHRPPSRSFLTSQLVPMSGRLIFELLSCPADHPHHPQHRHRKFVRLNINDGIVALPHCASGPGSSCPLEEFLAHVKRRGMEAGDFRKTCGLGDNSTAAISFLHQ